MDLFAHLTGRERCLRKAKCDPLFLIAEYQSWSNILRAHKILMGINVAEDFSNFQKHTICLRPILGLSPRFLSSQSLLMAIIACIFIFTCRFHKMHFWILKSVDVNLKGKTTGLISCLLLNEGAASMRREECANSRRTQPNLLHPLFNTPYQRRDFYGSTGLIWGNSRLVGTSTRDDRCLIADKLRACLLAAFGPPNVYHHHRV